MAIANIESIIDALGGAARAATHGAERFVLAVKREARDAVPVNWQQQVAALAGVRVIGNRRGMTIEATPDAVAAIEARFGAWLHVEGVRPRDRAGVTPGRPVIVAPRPGSRCPSDWLEWIRELPGVTVISGNGQRAMVKATHEGIAGLEALKRAFGGALRVERVNRHSTNG